MMTISKIKKLLSGLIGKKVKVIYYGSRNRKEVYYGCIYKLYQNVFLIRNDECCAKSFSYVDVLTKTVKIIY